MRGCSCRPEVRERAAELLVPLALFIGLMILTVATELPVVGGLVALVVTVLGPLASALW